MWARFLNKEKIDAVFTLQTVLIERLYVHSCITVSYFASTPALLEHWLSVDSSVPVLMESAEPPPPNERCQRGFQPRVFRGSSLPLQADRLMNRKLTDVTSVGRVIVVLWKPTRGDISVLPGNHGDHKWIMAPQNIRTAHFVRITVFCLLSVSVMQGHVTMIRWLTQYNWQTWEQPGLLSSLFHNRGILLFPGEMDAFRKQFWENYIKPKHTRFHLSYI